MLIRDLNVCVRIFGGKDWNPQHPVPVLSASALGVVADQKMEEILEHAYAEGTIYLLMRVFVAYISHSNEVLHLFCFGTTLQLHTHRSLPAMQDLWCNEIVVSGSQSRSLKFGPRPSTSEMNRGITTAMIFWYFNSCLDDCIW
jgi:hypothetical protein